MVPRSIPPWIRYGASLLIPIAIAGFLVTAPHRWPGWLAVLGVLFAVATLDRVFGQTAAPTPVVRATGALAILLAAGALHVGNAVILVTTAERMVVVDLAIAVLLVGIGTAYAGGIVGHELVHRSHRGSRIIARLLLWPAFYDHFAVEHVRGHHVHVATLADPTTARYGETFVAYAVRSVVGQLRSAWRIDRGTMFGAIIGEALVLVAIATTLGRNAAITWVLQALVATIIITAVNYFDHWGLQRSDGRFTAEDAWGCGSPLSHYALLGLPRHADHHLHAARPFDRLVPTRTSPVLPHGYVRMVLLVIFANGAARRMLSDELRAKGLGPFRPSTASAA